MQAANQYYRFRFDIQYLYRYLNPSFSLSDLDVPDLATNSSDSLKFGIKLRYWYSGSQI